MIRIRNEIPVEQLDPLTGNVIQWYPSGAAAERDPKFLGKGLHASAISDCICDKSLFAGGFMWRKANDVAPVPASNTLLHMTDEELFNNLNGFLPLSRFLPIPAMALLLTEEMIRREKVVPEEKHALPLSFLIFSCPQYFVHRLRRMRYVFIAI